MSTGMGELSSLLESDKIRINNWIDKLVVKPADGVVTYGRNPIPDIKSTDLRQYMVHELTCTRVYELCEFDSNGVRYRKELICELPKDYGMFAINVDVLGNVSYRFEFGEHLCVNTYKKLYFDYISKRDMCSADHAAMFVTMHNKALFGIKSIADTKDIIEDLTIVTTMIYTRTHSAVSVNEVEKSACSCDTKMPTVIVGFAPNLISIEHNFLPISKMYNVDVDFKKFGLVDVARDYKAIYRACIMQCMLSFGSKDYKNDWRELAGATELDVAEKELGILFPTKNHS